MGLIDFFIAIVLSLIETLFLFYIIEFYFIEAFDLNTDSIPFLISICCFFFFFQIFSYLVLFDYFIAISLTLIHTYLLVYTIKKLNLDTEFTWLTILFVCWLILGLRLYS